MEKPIVKDTLFLRIPSKPATPEDISVADDLRDTLLANRERCLGMAANMIGVSKSIIVFFDGATCCEMFNPKLFKTAQPFDTEEGCLSLTGVRPTKRFRSIKVQWVDRQFKPHIKTFTGLTAQIIQHEIDHISGIII